MNLAAVSGIAPPASSQLLVLPTCTQRDHETSAELHESVVLEESKKLAADTDLPNKPRRWQEEVTKVPLLSDRELEVFRLLGNGSSNRGIARNLRITERTAKAHMSQIMAKLGVESRLQAGLVSYIYQLTLACNIPLNF